MSEFEKVTRPAREYFMNAGLTYNTMPNFDILMSKLKSALAEHNWHDLRMTDCKIAYNKDGTFCYAEFRCSSDYFSGREAITFNGDGFIGFAGWACSNTVKPFTQAFKDWVDHIK